MPPQTQPTNAVPLVTYAQMVGLLARHRITLVTVAGPDPAEWEALEHCRALGVDVQAARRTEPTGLRRWQRRWRLGYALLRGQTPFRTAWFYEPELQRILDRLLSEQRFDLMQLDDNAVGAYHYRTNIPKIFTEHEVRRPRPVDWQRIGALVFRSQHADWRTWLWEELDWQRWQRYQLNVWRQFERLLVFTERDATSLRTLAPALADRVRVNPFGIVLPNTLNPQLEQRGQIVFSGGFSHQPNVDAALWLGHEIMPQLRSLYPDAHLTLVGSYPPPAVQALACDHITVTGRVPAIEPFIEQAAVVIAPLRIGGGMRTKVLQGMAQSKAVVTTSLGAMGLTIEAHQPPLAIADDAATLARLTAELLANDERRHELGQRARAFVVAHHSADAYARRLEAIYAEALQTD